MILRTLRETSVDTLPWLSSNPLPNSFWNDGINRKIFFDWLGNKLGNKEMEDWYSLTSEILSKNYGSTLLQRHKSSPIELLKEVYPNHDWLPWRFPKTPRGYWDDFSNVKSFF